MVALCPKGNDKSSGFLAAKLYYKMLSYKFNSETAEDEYNPTIKEDSPFSKLSKFKDIDHDEYE